MVFNYVKLAIRLLIRNPFFTFINVTGLAVGLSLFFILWQHAQYELRSDRFHSDWNRIVRFGLSVEWTDDKVVWQNNRWGTNGPHFTEMISEEYHEIESFTRVFHQANFVEFGSRAPDHDREVYLSRIDVATGSRKFPETKVAYVDKNIFRFFSISLLKGNEHSVLSSPHAVVVSESTARKYFGNIDPIGQTLLLNDAIPLTVTGVFENLPNNTHLDLDILLSLERIANIIPKSGWAVHCYLKLKPDTNVRQLSRRINEDQEETIKHVAWGSWPYGKAQIYLQPLSEVAFTTYMLDPHQPKSRFVLNIQACASFLILVMASINYANLTITACRKRFKEIGARQSVGANRSDFICQFVLEGAIAHLIALLIAITLIQLSRYPAELIFNFYVTDWTDVSADVVMIFIATTATGILITALYPVMVTLRVCPKNLFGALRTRKSNRIPSLATTFQFCIAVVLIIWITAIYKQINFILNADIGFSKEQVIVIDLPPVQSTSLYDRANAFGRDVIRDLKMKLFTISQSAPGDNHQGWISLKRTIADAGMQVESNGNVDESFIPFFDIKLVAGRNFLPDHISDSSSIIISEGTATRLAFASPEDAIGTEIVVNGNQKAEVIGVMNDYKIRPLTQHGYMNYNGKPGLALTYKNHLKGGLSSTRKKISFTVAHGEFEGALEQIEKKFKKIFPDYIFNWKFLDRIVYDNYKQYKIARNQVILFTIVAIGIACLGLLGMISNHATERTKEIGIRKILGATFLQIGSLLLKSTVMQFAISVAIGMPVAWYLSQQYLAGFSERVNLKWWDYSLPVVVFVLIMLGSIATVLWKSARSNPVDALRWE